ncbi:unnamed protein product [Strongylus vulgaris]|uniref:Uncharacterized protein n=1 Tax=Strongylus vulgaris TaxID=40348 RepID=A0A3P7IW92_STRVU|nr:unnamed protein product [Strongylus vulgaris]
MLGEPIAGSPFTAKAYDARMARLSQSSDAEPEVRVRDPQGNDIPVEITRSRQDDTLCIATYTPKYAARAGAGNMEIIVSVDNRNVPNFVQAEGQAKFKVSFTPQEAKEHVISVRFNGVSVPGGLQFLSKG